MRILASAFVGVLLVAVPAAQTLPPTFESHTAEAGTFDRPLEGFGASTTGGAGGDRYVVTSLADSGPGTLRDALSGSWREIEFEVGGTIALESGISVRGDHITLDGSTSPTPGVTITAAHSGVVGALLELRGASDIIIRHIRVTDAPDSNAGDNLRILLDAHDIVIDHVSLRRAGDGSLDISDGAHDVTVQWSIIAETVKNSLIRTGVYNLSFHHNLYVGGDERNPQLDDATNVDIVNNVVCDWSTNYGTRIRNGATANIVKNVYAPTARSDCEHAVVFLSDSGPVYMEGNDLPAACGATGAAETRFAAPPVTEMDARVALLAVLEEAGAFPRDHEDEAYVGSTSANPVIPASWGRIKTLYR